MHNTTPMNDDNDDGDNDDGVGGGVMTMMSTQL